MRGNRTIALETLTKWQRDIFVMPGGDQDTWRPHKDRYQVCFAGRKGYAWLALKAGVPIVPVANAGAHDTLIVLARGRRLARLLGLPRLARAEIWPVHLSLPYGLAVGPLPHIPFPMELRYQVGEAIYPPRLLPGTEPSEQMIADLDSLVQDSLQKQLDHLKREQADRLSAFKGLMKSLF